MDDPLELDVTLNRRQRRAAKSKRAPTLFLTDEELRTRWRCSAMTIWRLRARGVLRKGTKIDGRGKNLNRLDHVEAVEAAAGL